MASSSATPSPNPPPNPPPSPSPPLHGGFSDVGNSCNLCIEVFTKRKGLIEHQSAAHRDCRVICVSSKCQRRFKNWSEMAQHCHRRHPHARP